MLYKDPWIQHLASGVEGSQRVTSSSSAPLSRGIDLREGNSFLRRSAVFGIGSRATEWPRSWLVASCFCVWSEQGMWIFLRGRKDPEGDPGIPDPSRFLFRTRVPSKLLSKRLTPSRSRSFEVPPGSLSTKVSLRPIIIWVTARLWGNTSSIWPFIRIALWLASVGEAPPGRWPAVTILSGGLPPTGIETFRSLFRTPVSLSCPGWKFPIWPLISWGKWPKSFLKTGRRSIIIPSSFWKPSWIPSDLKGPVTGLPTGFMWASPRGEDGGIVPIGILFLLKPFFFTPLSKASGRFLLILTEEEAIALYHSGQEPTVQKLLELDRRVKELEEASRRPTPGGLALAWQRLARILLPWYESLGMLARTSSLLHVDETGWRVLGKAYWLWCFTNERIAYYLTSPSRASPVLKQVLGEFFKGILICDFFGAYNKITAFLKQRCLLHLLRDMIRTSVFHRTPQWRCFSKKLKRLVKDALRLGLRRCELPPEVYHNRCHLLRDRLAQLITPTSQDRQCLRLVKRVKRHQNELFTFLEHPEVAADNNHAERMIRPAVIARKNSYCNRSQKGAQTQAILMSIFRTLHLQKKDTIVTLEEAFKIYCQKGSLPSLFYQPEMDLPLAA